MPRYTMDPATPGFPHGTLRGYGLGCRRKYPCPETPACADKRREWDRLHRNAGKTLPTSRVDVEPARRHMQALLEEGCTIHQIAAASGVRYETVYKVLHHSTLCEKDTSDAITAVTVQDCKAGERLLRRYRDRYFISAKPAREHLHALLAVPGVNPRMIARHTGLNVTTVRHLMEGQYDQIAVSTVRRLMKLTVEQMKVVADRVPVTPKFIQVARSLQVQQWSIEWQAAQLGKSSAWLSRVLNGQVEVIDRADYEALMALAAKIERQARVKVNGNWGPSAESGTKARKKGWYPLAAYNEKGRLLRGAVLADESEEELEAKRLERNARAYRRLESLRMTIAYEYTAAEIAEKIGNLHADQVNRWRSEAGLRFLPQADITPFMPGVPVKRAVLRPECKERAARMMPILDRVPEQSADYEALAKELNALLNRLKEEEKEAREKAEAEAAAQDATETPCQESLSKAA